VKAICQILHLFLHLCAVKHCGVTGEAVPYDDDLAKSCFQVSNCFMQFPSHCLSLSLRRLVQVYHNEHMQPNVIITDVYTFLSIYNSHLLSNVIQKHIFYIQELHAVLPMHTSVTLCLVYEHNSDPSRGRSLKFGPLVQNGVMNSTS